MVYVGKREYPYRGMLMSHMVADSLEQLHAMADGIGVDRKWFQDKPGKPHYDISKGKKSLALELGALEVGERDIIRALKGELEIKCCVITYCPDEGQKKADKIEYFSLGKGYHWPIRMDKHPPTEYNLLKIDYEVGGWGYAVNKKIPEKSVIKVSWKKETHPILRIEGYADIEPQFRYAKFSEEMKRKMECIRENGRRSREYAARHFKDLPKSD